MATRDWSGGHGTPVQWGCKACTYLNPVGRTTCEMCETPRYKNSSNVVPTFSSVVSQNRPEDDGWVSARNRNSQPGVGSQPGSYSKTGGHVSQAGGYGNQQSGYGNQAWGYGNQQGGYSNQPGSYSARAQSSNQVPQSVNRGNASKRGSSLPARGQYQHVITPSNRGNHQSSFQQTRGSYQGNYRGTHGGPHISAKGLLQAAVPSRGRGAQRGGAQGYPNARDLQSQSSYEPDNLSTNDNNAQESGQLKRAVSLQNVGAAFVPRGFHPGRGLQRGGSHPRGGPPGRFPVGLSHTGQTGESSSNTDAIAKDEEMKHLLRIIDGCRDNKKKIGDLVADKNHIWLRAWKRYQKLSDEDIQTLLLSLSRMPDSLDFTPPSIAQCQNVSEQFLGNLKSSNSQVDPDTVVAKVEIVKDFVTRLIRIEWDSTKDEIKKGFTEILDSANNCLSPMKHPEHREMSKEIYNVIEEIERPWKINVKTSTISSSSKTSCNEIADWQKATIGWLSDAKRFQPHFLPVMNVPDSESKGVYESPEDYLETVEKIWTAMTFGEGNSAFSPKCKYRSHDGECGEVLGPTDDIKIGPERLQCRTPKCRLPVVLVCRRQNHNQGLCKKCSLKVRAELMGPPSPVASTQVYDGKVSQVDFEGKLYLKGIQSRKPPPSIHWYTTNRLNCPNLVALIKLSSSGASLQDNNPIHWAEIIYHGNPKEEHWRRQEGRLAVSLSNISEMTGDNPFQKGDDVAVIDCHTFVPEYIPVLKAISEQKTSPLPFQSGSLLNLSTKKKPSQKVRKQESSYVANTDELLESSVEEIQFVYEKTESFHWESDSEYSNESEGDSDICEKVENMICNSQLEPIIQVRQNTSKKFLLQNKLIDLIKNTTLDNEQLESFLGSLTYPVHLTQGPPGTGKSYLGVVIVRALMIIRKLWLTICPSKTTQPILVLSYKNHAIDEFLRDLIKSEDDISLVRIGGTQNEDPELSPYTEQNKRVYRSLVSEKQGKLRRWFDKRLALYPFQSNLSPLLKYKALLLQTKSYYTPAEEYEFNSAGYAAAIYLQNLICQIKVLQEKLTPDNQMFDDLDEIIHELFSPENEQKPLDLHISEIEKLWTGFHHYDQNITVTDVLLYWISNFKPSQKCVFLQGNNSCKLMADSEITGLCDNHQCKFWDQTRCTNEVPPNNSFCLSHRCEVHNCMNTKLNSRQSFCQIHSCFICIDLGLRAEYATGPPPRNSCPKHILCLKCTQLAGDKAKFCQYHLKALCSATTKRGSPCQNFVLSKTEPYCDNHLEQMKKKVNVQSKKDEKKKSIVCKSLTKKGKPCKAAIFQGSSFCHQHLKWHDKGNDAKNKLEKEESNDQNSDTEPNIESCSKLKSTTSEDFKPSSKINEKCQATTKKGFQCRSKPMIGQNFCTNHARHQKLSTETKSNLNQEIKVSIETDRIDPETEAGVEKIPIPDTIDETQNQNSFSFRNIETESITQNIDLPDESQCTDLIEEPENLQHLQDVYQVEEPEQQYIDDPDEETQDNQDTDDQYQFKNMRYINIFDWNWTMTFEERWDQCQMIEKKFSQFLGLLIRYMNKEVDSARREFHNAKVEATSKVYEGNEVLGGTIVGCITRLQAIRATKPFAIVVEEASEVLEPLLFSCIGSTTCKLELIGDHRQLQPSLTNKFSFERINKANISMFERLIRSPKTHSVPSTILATQRRMRKNICDLIRCFYMDIVEIKDHPSCSTKCIPKQPKYNHSMIKIEDKLWDSKGREVPGILPHIFFWTHVGNQQRAEVGASLTNPTEAQMVCKLAKYLITCGVSKSSIAILTPYKGQLMLMRKELMQSGLLSPRNYDNESCILSTVDRFQGDESDIVIISLVSDSKTQSPFVKKINRMIVLLSRAKIGMFIVGNMGYFEAKKDSSVEHWIITIQSLSSSSPSDSTNDNIDYIEYSDSRVGSSLPLCCPQHRESSLMATDIKHLQLGFCEVPCQSVLPCTHPCGLKCHYQNLSDHAKLCTVLVTSPCPHHPTEIECHLVYENVKNFKKRISGQPIDKVLPYYSCNLLVEVYLPCSHIVPVPCHYQEKAKEKGFPRCREPSQNVFIYPECKHEIQGECWQIEYYEKNPMSVPPCKQNVNFISPCGHSSLIPCTLHRLAEANPAKFPCETQVEVHLPRCGHSCTVKCCKVNTLLSWTGNQCSPIGTVIQGVDYGPLDHQCQVEANLILKCGHELKMPCSVAMGMSTKSLSCTEIVEVENPACGHPAKIPCYQKGTFENDSRMNRILPPIKIVEESNLKEGYQQDIIQEHCKEKIILNRQCGHQEMVECHLIKIGKIPICDQLTTTANPICGHDVSIKCNFSKFKQWNPWPEKSTYKDFIQNNELADNTERPNPTPSQVRQILKDCTSKITVYKNSTCGHKYETECWKAFKQLGSKNTKCKQIIPEALLKCGHIKQLECWDYDEYKQNPSKHPCTQEVLQPCWNFDICKNKISVRCKDKKQVLSCNKETSWTCANGHYFEKLQLCEKGNPQDCPECILSQIEDMYENIYAQNSIESFEKIGAKSTTSLPISKIKVITVEDEIERFKQAQIQVLVNYVAWLKKLDDLWSRPSFSLHQFSWFIPVPENTASEENLTILSISEKIYRGIEVFEWTSQNLQNLANSSNRKEITLMCGVGFSCNSFTNQVDYPASKERNKAGKMEHWISTQQAQGYDCAQITKDSKDLSQLSVLWKPYALMATKLITISLQGLQNSVSLPRLFYNQKPIQFKHFKDAEVSETPDFEQVKVNDQTIRLNRKWDCKSLSNQKCLNPAAEKELMSKLQCVPNNSSQNLELHGGVNLIESYIKQSKMNDLKLILCLELIELGDFENAQINIDQYISEHHSLAHPLLLLALGRLSKASKSKSDQNYLRKFSDLFPSAVDKWMTSEEREELSENFSEDIATNLDDDFESNDPQIRWEAIKKREGVTSESMENLLKLIGLRKVKNSAVSIFKAAIVLSKMDPEAQKANSTSFNFCFLGNPGTGKTTVARLMAGILKDCKVRANDKPVETSAQKLKDEGAKGFRALVQSATDGVILIDEAYELDPKGDSQGKPIVAELLDVSENQRDNLTIILAGYEDDMNTKLFSYNDGLRSRFENFNFEDFDADELKSIWLGELQKRKWSCEEKITKVVCQRLAKMKGRKGFGNGRAVRKEIERATIAARARPNFNPEDLELIIEDVLGKPPLTNPKIKKILSETNKKIGWTKIKEGFEKLVKLCDSNYKQQLNGIPSLPVTLNRLFLGNPGTGKTSCARIYGRLLKELNFLTEGDVIFCTASDLIGQYIGESQQKTKAVIERARGKVLVIDEAYNLDDKNFGKQALDVIVEKVQNSETDDIAVILIGYEENIRTMFRNQNPGLRRRFPIEDAFLFEDFNNKELLKIFNHQCQEKGIKTSAKVGEKALKILAKQKVQANFGNAGAVENIIASAVEKANARQPSTGNALELLPEDIDDGQLADGEDPFEPLNTLYNVEFIRQELIKLRNHFQVAKSEGSDVPELGHFLFLGSQGTGKTTVANVMAKILFNLGILARDHVEKTTGLKMTGQYVGQTKSKVEEILNSARGGILFIDEAYELGKGHYGEEALTSLVEALTNPVYKGMSVILAGYQDEIQDMLNRNTGMKSRFKTSWTFPNWKTEDCVQFIITLATKEHFMLYEEALLVLSAGFEKLPSFPNWGNARDVNTIWEDVKKERANRVVQTREENETKTIQKSDVEPVIDKIVKDRQDSGPSPKEEARKQQSLVRMQQGQQNSFKEKSKFSNKEKQKPNLQTNAEHQLDKSDTKQQQSRADAKEMDISDERDPDVPDDVWEEMERAKMNLKEKLEQIKKDKVQIETYKTKLEGLEESLQSEKNSNKRKDLQKKQKDLARKLQNLQSKVNQAEEEELKVQKKLQQIGKCPMGYAWIKISTGWRCSAGGHRVSDEELNQIFAA